MVVTYGFNFLHSEKHKQNPVQEKQISTPTLSTFNNLPTHKLTTEPNHCLALWLLCFLSQNKRRQIPNQTTCLRSRGLKLQERITSGGRLLPYPGPRYRSSAVLKMLGDYLNLSRYFIEANHKNESWNMGHWRPREERSEDLSHQLWVSWTRAPKVVRIILNPSQKPDSEVITKEMDTYQPPPSHAFVHY